MDIFGTLIRTAIVSRIFLPVELKLLTRGLLWHYKFLQTLQLMTLVYKPNRSLQFQIVNHKSFDVIHDSLIINFIGRESYLSLADAHIFVDNPMLSELFP